MHSPLCMDPILFLLCHLVGDYLLQSDWMASTKTSRMWPAFVHAVVYTIPFALVLTQSHTALAIIAGTHFIIDHWRLARYVCWLKNRLAPRWSPLGVEAVTVTNATGFKDYEVGDIVAYDTTGLEGKPVRTYLHIQEKLAETKLSMLPIFVWWQDWEHCKATGYHKDKPEYLAVWLLIITDNTLHLVFNYVALRWFT